MHFSRCGHCKSLAPVSSTNCLFLIYQLSSFTLLLMLFVFLLIHQVYEKVATVFKQEEGVVIANLDADAHKGLGEK